MWGALSDERTGLSFTIAYGSRQRSHSRIRVPWHSRPYFVSDSRLPFSSLLTTRTAAASNSTSIAAGGLLPSNGRCLVQRPLRSNGAVCHSIKEIYSRYAFQETVASLHEMHNYCVLFRCGNGPYCAHLIYVTVQSGKGRLWVI
jgi:hypothetical protein